MPRGRIEIDTYYCKGCGLCTDACPTHILEIDSTTFTDKGYHPAHCIDPDKCTGCATCALVCPDMAITVFRTAPKRATSAAPAVRADAIEAAKVEKSAQAEAIKDAVATAEGNATDETGAISQVENAVDIEAPTTAGAKPSAPANSAKAELAEPAEPAEPKPEPKSDTEPPVLVKGNEAMAEAAMRAGCRYYFGYPITPQTELAAYMAREMPLRGGVFLQAESEIGAINMVYGAAAAGGRAMTSSSSPGISLKGEGVSYMAGADLPGVIINVQRGGPGLGSIQPSQSDYWQATRALGHGDFFMPVFAPATVQEMADLVYGAFDVADRYRTPVMILADGALGQMMEPVVLPPEIDLASLPKKEWATTGTASRMKGTQGGQAGQSEEGTGGQAEQDTPAHNVVNSLYLVAENNERQNIRRFERYSQMKDELVRHEGYLVDDAEICIVAYGVCARIARSAIDDARAEGIRAGLLRPITLWPYPSQAVRDVGARAYLCVEMSMGQMIDDVRLALDGRAPVEFFGHTGGVMPTPEEVLEQLRVLNGKLHESMSANQQPAIDDRQT